MGKNEQNAKNPEETGHIAKDRRRGRGSTSKQTGRFETQTYEEVDDGWDGLAQLPAFTTEVRQEFCKTIISRNQSPDISFDRSINPYRGCEHGCSYCYARPSHAFWGLSPGLDFETRLTAKVNADEILKQELAKASYKVRPIALGTNTDPYQPIERDYKIMRRILKILLETKHPVTIVTKSHLITRDLDILSGLAKLNLVQVALSITTLDRKLARNMEPRASTPAKRLEALQALSQHQIPTAVMAAPMIPGLNDMELEAIMEAARRAGACDCGYILLRLPREVSPLFFNWMEEHYPNQRNKVFKLIKQMRGGKTYDANWRRRMRGQGPYAQLLKNRFQSSYKRLNFPKTPSLNCNLFTPPLLKGDQYSLFS